MLFLGIDLGSSSVKLSVIDGETGASLDSLSYPDTELAISSPAPGFAEQHPELWWNAVREGFVRMKARGNFRARDISAIGIAYQMHGLVMVDKNQQVLRPAIIWCDSRALPFGEAALEELGADYCFTHLLNSPGNFTAAKLRWVQLHQPDIFQRIHKIMLPGDFIAMKLSGVINTTASGLSEAALWDFATQGLAENLLDHWNMSAHLIPDLVPTLGLQARVSPAIAAELGLNESVVICYRAGDQPNNALSLNVLEPGEVAATAGTSGVIYSVTDKAVADRQSRVNTFLHVTHAQHQPRHGVLVCVNGCGRLNSWLRQMLGAAGAALSFEQMNGLAQLAPVGSEGLIFHPFGNGVERLFKQHQSGAQLHQLDFNRHSLSHVLRAAQEGIVFSLNQGFEVVKSLGGSCKVIRAAKGNLFLSDLFVRAFANTTQAAVELFDTNGAAGAARAAAIGSGFYASSVEAFQHLQRLSLIEPESAQVAQYQDAYAAWSAYLPH